VCVICGSGGRARRYSICPAELDSLVASSDGGGLLMMAANPKDSSRAVVPSR